MAVASALSFAQPLKTVKVGEQVWMKENLNVDRFRNGDLIPEATSVAQWENACVSGQPAWCYYRNDANNGSVYGRIYNWYAVSDPRGLAPKGFSHT
ncbi:MAG: fibrobacter succinogenes major paralogous domain-containing protein [Ignavibacteria bacterium]|nr:fibrobacter succinogenes major paralogous domain-containing protein [Ignavibacteria bacterium]